MARAHADHVVLVGDLFTKGPDPVGVWRQVAAGGWRVVRGNHDQRLLDHLDGLRPDDRAAARCVAALSAADPGWVGHARAWPLFLEVAGWTVVHAGLHPSGDPALTTPRQTMNLRRWPDERPTDPHWHEVYVGERRVVFGHDAVRGLVRVERDGRPWVIGLDSGCVYGGALTGYVLEEDLLVQVAAHRVWKPISG